MNYAEKYKKYYDVSSGDDESEDMIYRVRRVVVSGAA